MAFPSGASTITLTGTLPSPVAGTARTGRIVFTPSARLVDSTQKAIYSGGGSIALDADGKFSVTLLCNDDPDVLPIGWRWQIDEQPSGGTRVIYWIDLPSTLGPTVDLSALAEVSEPDGSGTSTSPTGPAGGALTGAYPNPELSQETIAFFDPAGSAATAQTAASADATAKVAAHTTAPDPHGDRTAAATALAAHDADTTAVHGIADTALLETAAGAQAKADAAQTAAAADASSKVATHAADTSDVHGIPDTAALETAAGAAAKVSAHSAVTTNVHGIADASVLETQAGAASKVATHAAAADPHADRAYADNKFATQLDVTALNGSVNTLSGSVTSLDGFVQDCLTRVAAIEQGTAYLAALNSTGPTYIDDTLTVTGYTTLQGGQFNNDFAAFGSMTLIGTDKRVRFRPTGGDIDVEGGGKDVYFSVWAAEDFTGDQHTYLRLESGAAIAHAVGTWVFSDSPFGGGHTLTGTTAGFFGAAPVSRPAVTGSRSDGTALASFLAALDTLGLIDDQTTA